MEALEPTVRDRDIDAFCRTLSLDPCDRIAEPLRLGAEAPVHVRRFVGRIDPKPPAVSLRRFCHGGGSARSLSLADGPYGDRYRHHQPRAELPTSSRWAACHITASRAHAATLVPVAKAGAVPTELAAGAVDVTEALRITERS